MLLLLAILFASTPALAESVDANGLVKKIEELNLQCTRKPGTCPFKELGSTPKTLESGRMPMTGADGASIPVSVIDEDDIKKLKGLYPPDLREYDDIVCAQRTHIIGDALGKKGIETAKLLLSPGLGGTIRPDDRARNNRRVKSAWDFHVVNLIYVRTKPMGKIETWVIDPFMEGLPVPKEKWMQRLRTNPSSSIDSETVLSRYNYPEGRWWEDTTTLTEYDPGTLKAAYEVMAGQHKHY